MVDRLAAVVAIVVIVALAVLLLGFAWYHSVSARLHARIRARAEAVERDRVLDDIRTVADATFPRYNPDGTVNAQHVVYESNMRKLHGVEGFYARLDAIAYRRSTDPQRA
jgi:hypothetical protein